MKTIIAWIKKQCAKMFPIKQRGKCIDCGLGVSIIESAGPLGKRSFHCKIHGVIKNPLLHTCESFK